MTDASYDSYSEFHGFNVADINQTLPTGLENDLDISISPVKTGELSQSSDEEWNVSEPGLGSDSSPELTWNADKALITACDFEEPVGCTLMLPADKNELDFFELLFLLYEWIGTETNWYAASLSTARGGVTVQNKCVVH